MKLIIKKRRRFMKSFKRCLFFTPMLFLLLADLTIKGQTFRERCLERHTQAKNVKRRVLQFNARQSVFYQPRNNDQQQYSDKHGNYNKGLAHEPNGFPLVSAYRSLLRALKSETQSDFNNIALGGARHLINPQASLAFDLASNDAWINVIPAAPNFNSAESAGEMVENYWSALLLDLPFNKFNSDEVAALAVSDLNTLTDFRGPKNDGLVTPNTLLRGNAPGELVGPYISQFLYLPVPLGSVIATQSFKQPIADSNFITTIEDWLIVANGGSTGQTITYDKSSFIRTPRDLTEYVHKDAPSTAGLAAALILSSPSFAGNLDPANPYFNNPTQDSFVTFGITQLLALVEEAAYAAMKAAWYQKWQVNRRLRPEEFGFYLDQQLRFNESLDIHPDLLNSNALPYIYNKYETYLLPQAFPEGSPTHPAYPSGHASFMGAAVTILKAWFNEDYLIPAPVMPNTKNSSLIKYTATPLTIGQELNKLASNIALGRDQAGVHYRSDGWQGMLLGEKIAIDILNNNCFLFNEDFAGFSLTTFEGNQITVGAKQTS